MTNAAEIDPDHLDFDPDALRAKYRAERDRRLRPEGNDQYRRIEGSLAHYAEDPYGDVTPRAPRKDFTEILIIGGGFGGLVTAARLKEAGFSDLRLLEHGGDVGGTWYWNRYPGAACDTEAPIPPLCEEVGYVPTCLPAGNPRACSAHWLPLRSLQRRPLPHRCYDLRWNEDAREWVIATNRGDALRARFVIMSNGPLNTPKLPGVPGIESFKGHTFHTSRWDYAYTGGSAEGGLSELADKRVAIIGTGATAVQCIPHLGASAKALYVFQRTPSSIDVRNNRPTDPAWAESLQPGWQKERMENFNVLTSGGIVDQDLVMDGWTEIIRNLISMANFRGTAIPREEVPRLMELADFQKMNAIRARVAIVEDPAAAEAPALVSPVLQAPLLPRRVPANLNRPNVHLIDTRGQGVERHETGAATASKPPWTASSSPRALR